MEILGRAMKGQGSTERGDAERRRRGGVRVSRSIQTDGAGIEGMCGRQEYFLSQKLSFLYPSFFGLVCAQLKNPVQNESPWARTVQAPIQPPMSPAPRSNLVNDPRMSRNMSGSRWLERPQSSSQSLPIRPGDTSQRTVEMLEQ